MGAAEQVAFIALPPALFPKGPLRAPYTADNAPKATSSTHPTLQKTQAKTQEKTQAQVRNQGRGKTGRIHTVAEAAKRIVTRQSGGENSYVAADITSTNPALANTGARCGF